MTGTAGRPTRVAFHLGYHKTATTWLQREILPRHPAIRLFVEGSPHGSPFLQEIIGRSDRDFDPARARRSFDERVAELAVPDDGVVVVSAERLSGHAATGGYDTFRIARRLRTCRWKRDAQRQGRGDCRRNEPHMFPLRSPRARLRRL